MYLKNYLYVGILFFIICFWSSTGFSQTRDANGDIRTNPLKICDGAGFSGPSDYPTENTSCPSTSIVGWIDAGCDYVTIPLTVYCINLDPSVTQFGQTVFWPGDKVPIYLRYLDANGDIVVGPIETWEYTENYQVYPGQSTIYTVFEGVIDLVIPETNLQNCSEPDNLNISDITVEIVRSGRNGGYDLYPIDQYGTQEDLFSCDVFEDNCNLCPSFWDICEDASVPTYELSLCFDCLDCNSPPGTQRSGVEYQSGTLSNLYLEVNPNPFSNSIQYQIQSSIRRPISVSLYSLSGKELFNEKRTTKVGMNSFTLDTSFLPEGIYYLKVDNNEEQSIIRVVKVN